MDRSTHPRPSHPSSALFSQGFTTKNQLVQVSTDSYSTAATPPPPPPLPTRFSGPTTTQLCCSLPSSLPHPSTTYQDSPPCLDCDSSPTPPQPGPLCVTRIYPSPPLTGTALKKSVPLPELNSESVMDPASDQDPSHAAASQVMSHDDARVDSALFYMGTEPLSPPPTLPILTQDLPSVVNLHQDLPSPSPLQFTHVPGPRLPSPTDDEAPLPPCKRLRREKREIRTDSSSERSPTSPESPWSFRSNSSGDDAASSVTAYSSYSSGSSSNTSANSCWITDASELCDSSGIEVPLDIFSPSSPSPRTSSFPSSPSSSLDMSGLSGLSPPYPDIYESDVLSFPRSSSGRPKASFGTGLLWLEPSDHDMDMVVDPLPSSPRGNALQLPSLSEQPSSLFSDSISVEFGSNSSYSTPAALSLLPSSSSSSSSPPTQPFQSLPHYQDILYLTPVPRSPHATLSALPDLDMGDPFEAPASPHSPHSELPELSPDEEYYFSHHPFRPDLHANHPHDTISPSLLSSPPPPPLPSSSSALSSEDRSESEGLGLFIQSDPPLQRSPSPEDDVLQFLEIQFDPATSNLDVSEFIGLRSMRKRALEAEREARTREANLNERVANAASSLLPNALVVPSASTSTSLSSPSSSVTPVVSIDPSEKRARKHELHVAMDLRAEARKDRKRAKQKSKEIGALLDLKMHGRLFYPTPMLSLMGPNAVDSVRQLVAGMMIQRKGEAGSRSLAGRRAASAERKYRFSGLSREVVMTDDQEDREEEREEGWSEGGNGIGLLSPVHFEEGPGY